MLFLVNQSMNKYLLQMVLTLVNQKETRKIIAKFNSSFLIQLILLIFKKNTVCFKALINLNLFCIHIYKIIMKLKF